jgi:hypothetical protein
MPPLPTACPWFSDMIVTYKTNFRRAFFSHRNSWFGCSRYLFDSRWGWSWTLWWRETGVGTELPDTTWASRSQWEIWSKLLFQTTYLERINSCWAYTNIVNSVAEKEGKSEVGIKPVSSDASSFNSRSFVHRVWVCKELSRQESEGIWIPEKIWRAQYIVDRKYWRHTWFCAKSWEYTKLNSRLSQQKRGWSVRTYGDI